MECNYKFQFDEVQGHLRAQRRPSCERQRHLRGTGHRPAREVSTSKPHNESIKNDSWRSWCNIGFTRSYFQYHCKKTESIVYKADRRYC